MTTTRDVVRGGSFAPLQVQTYGHIANVLDIPSLIKIQVDSFDWFKREGLRELLDAQLGGPLGGVAALLVLEPVARQPAVWARRAVVRAVPLVVVVHDSVDAAPDDRGIVDGPAEAAADAADDEPTD